VYKASLGDKKRKNFLIQPTLLFHTKKERKKERKVRMGIIHDELEEKRKVVKKFVDVFSTAYLDLGQKHVQR
jgi:negative regulator of replication initiation